MDIGRVVLWILPRGEQLLRLLALGCLFRGAIGRTPSRFFNEHALLCLDKNVPHLGGIVLHQMLVEWVGDLQPTDECSVDHIFIAVYTKPSGSESS